jgi:hypothetical protein
MWEGGQGRNDSKELQLPGKADTISMSLEASAELQYVSKLYLQNWGKI